MEKKTLLFLLLLTILLSTAKSQQVLIRWYDETMHVVDVHDYDIHYQSEKEYEIRIKDSVIVDFFLRHFNNLKQCDTIPQSVNSMVQIIYEYKNKNFDVLTFNPLSPYTKNGICKNGRMHYYDFALDKVVLSIIKDPRIDGNGQFSSTRAVSIKKLISKLENNSNNTK